MQVEILQESQYDLALSVDSSSSASAKIITTLAPPSTPKNYFSATACDRSPGSVREIHAYSCLNYLLIHTTSLLCCKSPWRYNIEYVNK
jgi:hypothetical protein